jgi:hypothetical protein
MAKVGPTVLEMAKPVLNDPIDHRTEVQLMAECVELSAEANTLWEDRAVTLMWNAYARS